MKIDHKKLRDIAQIVAGQSPPSTSYNKSGDGMPFFQGKTDFTERHPIIRNWCTAPAKIALPNDILISVRAPVGPVNICNVTSCIGRGLSAIRVNNDVNSEYVYLYLKDNERRIAKLGVGSTFEAITQKDVNEFKIPIPEDYRDQIRIATILTKAEALGVQRKESLRLLDELMKSTFLEMFGDPVSNEKEWEKGKIAKYTNCIVPGRNKPKSFSGNIPWITTDDLIDKAFIDKSKKGFGLNDYEIKEVRAKIIPAGSVLVTCVGDLGIVSINKIPVIVNQQLHAYQCSLEVNNIFLMYVLSFQEQYMYKAASTTTVPYMNKSICNSIPVIKPPIVLQTQFAQIVEKVEALKAHYQVSLKELENLYGSLSQRAFKGELGLSRAASDLYSMQEC